MINILPPEHKKQVEYSRRNVIVLRYVFITGLLVLALAALLVSGLLYSNHQITQLESTLAEHQKQREIYKETELKVQALQATLNSIDKLFNEKTQYSSVLNDLASVLPAGSYITSMTLTGDDSKPMQIIIHADSFNTAGQVRTSLLTSDRIKSADVQSILAGEEGGYIVDIIIAFNQGKAR